MLGGSGIFDRQNYCVYVSEQLGRYLGDNAHNRLDALVEERYQKEIRDAFMQAESGEPVTLYVPVRRADAVYRMCRIRVMASDETLYHVNITDVDAVCDCFYEISNQNEKMRYVAEKQGFIIFEYFFRTDEIQIYSYDGDKKVFFTDDTTYEELKRNIRKDAQSGDFGASPFIFEKMYTIGSGKYAVKGNAVIKASEKYEIVGLIVETEGDIFGSSRASNIHDAATGLFNKVHSMMLARKAVNLKKYRQVTLVMIDIDDFKVINDTYGHLFGDEVIKKFAYIIREAAINRGFVGRFGGDEFFMCIYDIGTEKDLLAMIDDIYYKFKMAFAEQSVSFTCSMGVSEYTRNSQDFDILIKKADRALYIAKYQGKNRYIIYDEERDGELNEEGSLQTVCQRESIDREYLLKELNQCFLSLLRAGKAQEEIRKVLYRVMRLYQFDGISVFSGEGWKRKYIYGRYTAELEDAGYMDNHRVRNLFSQGGVFIERLKHIKEAYIEEFHGKLKSHGVVSTIQCLTHDGANLITFDSMSEHLCLSDEQVTCIMLFANLLAERLNNMPENE